MSDWENHALALCAALLGASPFVVIALVCWWYGEPINRSAYAERVIQIRAKTPDRSSLQSVVHYVQPEAAPDLTFTGCWTTELADAMGRTHEGAPLA
jgi:hypothetical protein